jgi:hypothetical protein
LQAILPGFSVGKPGFFVEKAQRAFFSVAKREKKHIIYYREARRVLSAFEKNLK